MTHHQDLQSTMFALRLAVLVGGVPSRSVVVLLEEEAGEYMGVIWENSGEVRTVRTPEAEPEPEVGHG